MEKGKIVLKMNGGLGNQMFQWAFGRMLEETTDMELFLDMSYFSNSYARPYQLDIFEIEPKFADSHLEKFKLDLLWKFRKLLGNGRFLGYKIYEEKQFNFDRNFSKIGTDTYIIGFFQTEMYFRNIANKIREDFRFKNAPEEANKILLEKINSTESVSLHIRRGDYVSKQRYKETYAQCSINYYKRAVEYIAQKHPDLVLYVFSDDIDWVRENLKMYNYKHVLVSNNTGKKSWEDMRLMSSCKHNIIANSSFSWWGAWLNSNQNKIVIAPKKWFNDESIIQTDIIPKTWIQLDN